MHDLYVLGVGKNRMQVVPVLSYSIKCNPEEYPDEHELLELFVDSDRHKELIDVCIKTPRKNKDGKDMKKTKSELLVHIEDNKEFLWDGIFLLLKPRNYVFNHTIITDGYSCSLRFIKISWKNNNIKLKSKKWKICVERFNRKKRKIRLRKTRKKNKGKGETNTNGE
jgi:hypothetical protein